MVLDTLRIGDTVMNKKTQPESFSFVLLKGESLAYKNSTFTPNADPYLVTGTTTALDTKLVQEWFLNNIVPLIGQAAADEMRNILEKKDVSRVKNFLDEALKWLK